MDKLRVFFGIVVWLSVTLLSAGETISFKSALEGPDYSNLKYWSAHPNKHDTSDSIPGFCNTDGQRLDADLFFIHPTSYFPEEDGAWNASLNDREVNQTTDYRSILFQTAAFNGSCRIYAPRYRQAGMKTFYAMGTPDADTAFEMAYRDVREAFLHFLEFENQERPIVIASHSQGSLHAIRLLQEFFDGTPLSKRLVVAYVVGYPIEVDAFAQIPVCATPEQTACVAGWRTFAKGEYPRRGSAGDLFGWVVNPITWSTDTIASLPHQHYGIMMGFDTLMPNSVIARIESKAGIVWVDTDALLEERREPLRDYHTYDINLFWVNIRKNVRNRIDRHLMP